MDRPHGRSARAAKISELASTGSTPSGQRIRSPMRRRSAGSIFSSQPCSTTRNKNSSLSGAITTAKMPTSGSSVLFCLTSVISGCSDGKNAESSGLKGEHRRNDERRGCQPSTDVAAQIGNAPAERCAARPGHQGEPQRAARERHDSHRGLREQKSQAGFQIKLAVGGQREAANLEGDQRRHIATRTSDRRLPAHRRRSRALPRAARTRLAGSLRSVAARPKSRPERPPKAKPRASSRAPRCRGARRRLARRRSRQAAGLDP